MQSVNVFAQTNVKFIRTKDFENFYSKLLKKIKSKGVKSISYTEMNDYFTISYILETDSIKKAEYYYYASVTDFALKNYPKARDLALQSAKYNPKKGKPYILIAKMYAASASICGKNHFEKSTVYWAAVDKLEEAKRIDTSCINDANQFIKKYSNRFPEYSSWAPVQKTYKIGCWINETTTMRFK